MSTRWRGTCAVVAALVAMAGCSDTDTAEQDSRSDSEPVADTANSGDVGESASVTDPIRIGISGPFESQTLNLPEVQLAAAAAVAAINERGGVDGRELELVPCNDSMNPDGAAGCARDFAEDDSMVAVVGSTSVLGAAFVPVLEEAGIPDVGAYPTTPLHLQSPVVYPLQGGIFSAYAGDARVALDEGMERVAVIYNDLPTAALILGGIDSVFSDAGVEPVASVPLAVTVSDVSSAVQETLRSQPDGIIVAFAQPMLSKLIQAFEQAGGDVPLLIGSGDLNEEELLALGSAADNVIGTSPLPPVTTDQPVAAVARFNEEMDEYAPGAKRNAVALNAWAAVQLFAEAAESAEKIDREGIIAALDQLDAYDTEGLTPTIDFSATPTVEPRLFNTHVAPLRIADGLYEFGGTFLDPYSE